MIQFIYYQLINKGGIQVLNIILQETLDLIAPQDPKAFNDELFHIKQEEQQAQNELIKEQQKWGFISINQTKELQEC
jgi:hypothetical protein